MQEADYQQLRTRLLRDGHVDDAFYRELREVAARLVRRRALPPMLAPYGVWNEEAVDEVFQAWTTRRLLGGEQLRPLVARAGDLRIFRGRAERSLRQFLLNERDRTQAQNLFERLRELLERDPSFRCFIDSTRSQDRWWGLSFWRQPQAFSGSAMLLAGAAWAAGDLTVIRYRADARKLSPVLDHEELKRFASVVLETVDALLTIRLLIDALRARVDLDDGPTLPLLESNEPASPPAVDEAGLRELAEFARDELTDRQAAILLATADGRPLAEIGRGLGCSAATVLNEQRRVGELLTRLSADSEERAELLNVIVDLLYESTDNDA